MGKPKSVIRERTSNITDLAAFAGVSRTTIYEWQRLPGYPKAADGSVCKWDLCEWYLRRSMAPQEAELQPQANTVSQSLEKFRDYKAQLAEIDVQERLGELVPLAKMKAYAMRLAGLWRNCLDLLQRRHGDEVYETCTELLENILNETDREFGDNETPQT